MKSTWKSRQCDIKWQWYLGFKATVMFLFIVIGSRHRENELLRKGVEEKDSL